MKKRIALYVRSLFSVIHTLFVKILHPAGFHSPLLQDFSLTTRLSVSEGGKLFLKKHIHTKRNVVIESDGGIIDIGEGCFFNNGCVIVSKDRISIGNYTSFGPNVMVYDHDHNIHSPLEIHDSGFRAEEVIIGDNVWIGANTVILRGSVIGNGSVVGAGSVIKGTYPPRSVIVQKRAEIIRERMCVSGG